MKQSILIQLVIMSLPVFAETHFGRGAAEGQTGQNGQNGQQQQQQQQGQQQQQQQGQQGQQQMKIEQSQRSKDRQKQLESWDKDLQKSNESITKFADEQSKTMTENNKKSVDANLKTIEDSKVFDEIGEFHTKELETYAIKPDGEFYEELNKQVEASSKTINAHMQKVSEQMQVQAQTINAIAQQNKPVQEAPVAPRTIATVIQESQGAGSSYVNAFSAIDKSTNPGAQIPAFSGQSTGEEVSLRHAGQAARGALLNSALK